jgi:peptide/nickel transport system substrate-binding protein
LKHKLITTLLILLLSACTSEDPVPTLNIGFNAADAGKIDPHLATGSMDKGLVSYMFNGLVRIPPGEINPAFIEPDLATNWTSTDDLQHWVFTIREGVQCHGKFGELDAHDVAYSLKRAADPKRSSFASSFKAIKHIEATGDYEVTIQLKEPVPSLLALLVPYHGGNIVCQDAVESLGDAFSQHPIGTGPFMFDKYLPQQYVKLVANPDYWRGEPKIKEIYSFFIPSNSTRDLAFRAGELDIIVGREDPAWTSRMAELSIGSLLLMRSGEMSVIHLNQSIPPLDDIRVRRAIAHSINREAMVEFRGESLTDIAYSPVPEGNLGYSANVPRYEYSVEKAKRLLTEAGYPNGLTINAIHTLDSGMLPTIQAVQGQLRLSGINLEIETVEHATFHAQIRQNLSQVVHYASARFPIADVYLSQFFHSDSTVGTPTAIANFSHCKAADEEIKEARTESNRAEQLKKWELAQQKIMEQVCAVPLFQILTPWAISDRVDLGIEVKGSLNITPPITENARIIPINPHLGETQ